MAYKISVLQMIGEDIRTDDEIAVTKMVDTSSVNMSPTERDYIINPIDATQYKCMRGTIARSRVNAIRANNPDIISILDASIASQTEPQITTLTTDAGWVFFDRSYLTPSSTNSITCYRSIRWDTQNACAYNTSYTVTQSGIDIIFISRKIESGNYAGDYYGIIFDDHGSSNQRWYLVQKEAWGDPYLPPETPSETPTASPSGHMGTGRTTKGSMQFVNYAGALSRVNTGTHGLRMYDVGEGAVNALYERLWSQDIWDKWANRKFSPIGGILSLHRVPLAAPTAGTVSSVTIAGQQYPVGSAALVSDNIAIRDFAEVQIPEIAGSFLDYAPYCSAMLYLPFIGSVGIDVNTISSGSIAVRYTFDLISGNCIAQVRTVDRDGSSIIYGTYAGNAAYKYPISGNDNGGFAVLGAAAGIATAGLAVAATGGSAAPLAASIVSGAASSISAEHHLQQAGSLPANTSALGDLRIYLVITRPAYLTPDGYEDIKGYPAGDGHTVGSYTGLLSGELHADSIPSATDWEKKEIERLFAEGVII